MNDGMVAALMKAGIDAGVARAAAPIVLTDAFSVWLSEQPVYSLDAADLILELPTELRLRLKDYVLSQSHTGTRTHQLVTREKVCLEALDGWLTQKGF